MALVSEYIEGKTLKELMEESPDRIDEYLNIFVDLQMEIFSKRVLLINRMKDKYKNRISSSDVKLSNILF